jgi:hypothetical protein
MPDVVGKATYQLETDATGVTKGLKSAEGQIKQTGAAAEKAFAKQTTGALGKMKASISGIAKGGGIGGAILGGVGIGAGLGVFSLATKAIGTVTDYLGDAMHAAIEDEQAQAKLNQTIKASIPLWDGNTAAIDDAITKGAALAFTDDDVRAGLEQLIPRTKDIAEANKLNALAMDLARAKSISLEEAALLVGKAYSGQASSLKRAGVALTQTKDSTKALAELQTLVAGQAQTYAERPRRTSARPCCRSPRRSCRCSRTRSWMSPGRSPSRSPPWAGCGGWRATSWMPSTRERRRSACGWTS